MTENNVKQTPKQLLWTCAAIVLGNFLLAFAVAAVVLLHYFKTEFGKED